MRDKPVKVRPFLEVDTVLDYRTPHWPPPPWWHAVRGMPVAAWEFLIDHPILITLLHLALGVLAFHALRAPMQIAAAWFVLFLGFLFFIVPPWKRAGRM